MPRKKKSKWGKRATMIGVMLGFAASIPMNLLSAWLQEKVVINLFYLFLVLLLVAAIIYSGRKMRTPDFLNNIFWFLLATVTFNLISTWVQFNLLHDTFSFSTVTLVLSVSVMLLAISALLQSHFLKRWKQSMRMKYRWNAINMRLASEYSENPVRNLRRKKRLPRQKRRL